MSGIFLAVNLGSNRERHVDTAKNVVRVGFAIKQGLAFEVSLERFKKQINIKNINLNKYTKCFSLNYNNYLLECFNSF